MLQKWALRFSIVSASVGLSLWICGAFVYFDVHHLTEAVTAAGKLSWAASPLMQRHLFVDEC